MKENEVSIELYKEIYTEELKTKSSIDSQIVLPMNLMVLLIGAGLFIFKQGFNNRQYNLYTLALILLFTAFAAALVVSIVHLTKMFLNGFSTYKYLPSASDLYQKEIQLPLFDKNQDDTAESTKRKRKKALNSAKIEFNKQLLAYYIDSASHNRKTNDERSAVFYYAKLYLITSLILIGIIGFMIIKK